MRRAGRLSTAPVLRTRIPGLQVLAQRTALAEEAD